MAEAMEFDFSLPSNEGKKFDPELVEKVKKIQQEANGKTQTEQIPEEYLIEKVKKIQQEANGKAQPGEVPENYK